MGESPAMDLGRIKTYPLRLRKNLTTRADFVRDTKGVKPWGGRRFRALVRRVVEAATTGHEVLVHIGAHVIKTGQSLLLIDLMEKGIITHLAMNGAEVGAFFEKTLERVIIANVDFRKLKEALRTQPLEVLIGAATAEVVQENDLPSLGQKPLGEIRSDETRSFRYKSFWRHVTPPR